MATARLDEVQYETKAEGGVVCEIVETKEELGKETRRKPRAFWAPVGFVIGAVVGYVCASIF